MVATTVPHLAYLRTHHKAVLPPLERDTDTAGRLLDEVPVSYLVLTSLGLRPSAQATPRRLSRSDPKTGDWSTPRRVVERKSMNGSVEVLAGYNTRVARCSIASCSRRVFEGGQQFFKKMSSSVFVISQPGCALGSPGEPCAGPPVHGLPVKRFSTFKNFKTSVSPRGKLGVGTHLIVGVYLSPFEFCARAVSAGMI